jgi:hypothetical protein
MPVVLLEDSSSSSSHRALPAPPQHEDAATSAPASSIEAEQRGDLDLTSASANDTSAAAEDALARKASEHGAENPFMMFVVPSGSLVDHAGQPVSTARGEEEPSASAHGGREQRQESQWLEVGCRVTYARPLSPMQLQE